MGGAACGFCRTVLGGYGLADPRVVPISLCCMVAKTALATAPAVAANCGWLVVAAQFCGAQCPPLAPFLVASARTRTRRDLGSGATCPSGAGLGSGGSRFAVSCSTDSGRSAIDPLVTPGMGADRTSVDSLVGSVFPTVFHYASKTVGSRSDPDTTNASQSGGNERRKSGVQRALSSRVNRVSTPQPEIPSQKRQEP